MLKSYERKRPSAQRDPIPFELAIMIASILIVFGYKQEAIGVLIQHDALLRTEELLKIKTNDIVFSQTHQAATAQLAIPVLRCPEIPLADITAETAPTDPCRYW